MWTTNLTGVLLGFGMFASFLLLPQLVEMPEHAGYGFDATVTEAGIFMAPSALCMLFAGPLAGVLAGRLGARLPLLIGTLVGASSFALLTIAHDERGHIYLAGALTGIGLGFAFASMANLIVEAVPPLQTGVPRA